MSYNNCLYDYVGLLGCNTTTPTSGRYVNSLPGISLYDVDSIANKEQVTFANVWDDVQERASIQLFSRLRKELSNKYKLNGLQHSIGLTKNITTNTTSASAKYRGLVIDLDNFTSEQHYVSSNFQQINVQQLRLYLPSAQNVPIKIFDLITGTQIYSSTITGIQGWNTLEVNEKYSSRKIFIAYNATSVIGSELYVSEDDMCCGDCNVYLHGGESSITTSVYENGVTKANNSFGLSPLVTVECTYDTLVCNNKEIFLNSYWYLLGVELMNERIFSPRINKLTTVDANKGRELKEYFEQMFEKEIVNAVSGINIDLCDCCVDCNSPIQIKENYG